MKVRRALVVALVAAAALVGAVRAQEDLQAMQPGSDDGDAEAVVERNDNTMDMQKQNAVDPENTPEARARHDALIRAATIRAQKKYDRLEALAEKEDEREDQEDAKEDREELRRRRGLSDRLREAQQKHDRQQAEQMRRLEAETNKEDRQKREADEKTAASVARVEADRNRKVDQQIADWRAFEARQKQAGELEEKRVAELRVKAAEVESKRQKALEEQQKEQAQKRVVEETAKAKVEAANKAAAEVSSKAVERAQKTAAEQVQKKQEQAQKAQEQLQKQQEQAQKKQEQAQKQQAEQAQKARFRPWQWRTVAQRVCFSANQANQGPAVEQSRFFVDAGVPVTITGWRLRHLSGGVSCSGPPQPGAFWGCGSAQSADMLSTWVVDANNFWVVPNHSVRGYIDRHIGPNVRGQTPWYMLSGQSNGSPTLQFLGSRVPVTSRTEFRVMYGEVATQWTLSDNHGTACVAVDVYYGTDGLQYP